MIRIKLKNEDNKEIPSAARYIILNNNELLFDQFKERVKEKFKLTWLHYKLLSSDSSIAIKDEEDMCGVILTRIERKKK